MSLTIKNFCHWPKIFFFFHRPKIYFVIGPMGKIFVIGQKNFWYWPINFFDISQKFFGHQPKNFVFLGWKNFLTLDKEFAKKLYFYWPKILSLAKKCYCYRPKISFCHRIKSFFYQPINCFVISQIFFCYSLHAFGLGI